MSSGYIYHNKFYCNISINHNIKMLGDAAGLRAPAPAGAGEQRVKDLVFKKKMLVQM